MERQDLSLFCRSKTDFAREHTSKEFFLEHQELSLFVVQKPILLANIQEFFFGASGSVSFCRSKTDFAREYTGKRPVLLALFCLLWRYFAGFSHRGQSVKPLHVYVLVCFSFFSFVFLRSNVPMHSTAVFTCYVGRRRVHVVLVVPSTRACHCMVHSLRFPRVLL